MTRTTMYLKIESFYINDTTLRRRRRRKKYEKLMVWLRNAQAIGNSLEKPGRERTKDREEERKTFISIENAFYKRRNGKTIFYSR